MANTNQHLAMIVVLKVVSIKVLFLRLSYDIVEWAEHGGWFSGDEDDVYIKQSLLECVFIMGLSYVEWAEHGGWFSGDEDDVYIKRSLLECAFIMGLSCVEWVEHGGWFSGDQSDVYIKW